jgi:hypothetical protein
MNLRPEHIGCPEFRRLLRADRRGFLRSGFLGFAGLSLSNLLRMEAQAKATGGSPSRDKSVIILWMRGGPSQHETWDPKPDAPQDYRGAFGAMRTSVPGVQICDLLPMSAKIQHKYSVIRSLHHTDAGHSAGDQIMFTGHPPGQNVEQNAYPSCGSIVAKELGHLNPKLPPYVIIPRNLPGSGPAYLGSRYGAFETQADPAKDGPFSLPTASTSAASSSAASTKSAATWTPPARWARWTASSKRRGTSSVAPTRARPSTSTPSR